MKPTPSLTIGIPCYNESIAISKVVTDFRKTFPDARILVIDNASTDNTAELARTAGADVVPEMRKGKGYAVQRLFSETQSDLLIMADGDDTYPAEEAWKLLDTLHKQGGDTVVGTRCSDSASAFKSSHTKANEILSWAIGQIFQSPVGDLFSGYRLFTRHFYKNIPLLSTGFEVETELATQTIHKGFIQRDVSIQFRSRPEGSFSKLHTFRDGFRVLRTIVLVVKDFRPLLFFSLLSLLMLLLSLSAGLAPILDYTRFQYVYHVPLAILATGLAILSALCLVCGLILDTIVRYEKETFFLRLRNQ